MIAADQLLSLHDRWTGHWHLATPEITDGGMVGLVQRNHLHNFSLWHEEDVARRDDLGMERIVLAKRSIDSHNQLRNDCVERMDLALMDELPPLVAIAPLHSETPGMIIDRLSILSLKLYHMGEEAGRPTAEDAHRRSCAEKAAILKCQRMDLAGCLDALLLDLSSGRRRFALYRQFKMYNDPAFRSGKTGD